MPLGSVSDELLRKSPDFPYGVCCNAGAYLEEWENVKDKASLVAVDWGDTARIDLYSPPYSCTQGAAACAKPARA